MAVSSPDPAPSAADGMLDCERRGYPCSLDQVGLTTDFFRDEYPSGLPDRIIAIMACFSMRFPDLSSHFLADSDGVILGYPLIVWTTASAEVRGRLFETIARGLPIEDALAANAAQYSAPGAGDPRLAHIGNTGCRGRLRDLCR